MIPYELMDNEIRDYISELCNHLMPGCYKDELPREHAEIRTFFIDLANNAPANLRYIYGEFNDKKSGDALDFFDNVPKWHKESICLYGDLHLPDIIDKYGIKKYVSIQEVNLNGPEKYNIASIIDIQPTKNEVN